MPLIPSLSHPHFQGIVKKQAKGLGEGWTGLAHPTARNSSPSTTWEILPLPSPLPAWVQRKKAENTGETTINYHDCPMG